ncbi:pol polyprotein [Pseudoloma neurophilia]|uniref:RNA-directed DNA polymerase n=1 Tax=Pseudoloma neurophilia TaxID=146866 RepID=A0A0R0M263_9MICR|nr:pol polyprotein [Pseudoloma neurophilia]
MEQEAEKNKLHFDMASAAKLMPRFAGEEHEDVSVWIRDCALVISTARLTDDLATRVMILALDGKARSWAALALQGEVISRCQFIEQIKTRFHSQNTSNSTLTRFLHTNQVSTFQEYNKLLQDATLLHDRQLLQTKPLVQLLITKSPAEIKTLLYQKGQVTERWDEIVKIAEEASWIAFPDSLNISNTTQVNATLGNVSNKQEFQRRSNNFGNKNKKPPKNCEFHGRCAHTTEECYILKKAEGILKKSPPSKTNSAMQNVAGEEENEEAYIYSTFDLKFHKNPFFISVKCNDKLHTALLDTGADTSIINKMNLPPGTEVTPTKTQIIAASGDTIKIIGQARNVLMKVAGKEIIVHPFVTETEPQFTIIGSPTIQKHPELLTDILMSNTYRRKNVNCASSIHANFIKDIVNRFNSLFQHEITQKTACKVAEHKIQTGNALPVAARNHRIPVHWIEKLDSEVRKLAANKMIRESNSPWCSRVVPIPKKDGSIRLCVDYRPLNLLTIKDKYPLPRIDEIIDSLAQARFFSTLDATSGYYQIPIAEEDKEKTAFSWKGNLYEFNRMPFGLCNAPATFQRIMDKVLREEIGDCVMVYLDDIIIFSKTEDEHKQHINTVLGKLMAASIFLNKNKCAFFRTEIAILGQIVKHGTVKPDPDKTRAILDYERPTDIRGLRSFLGLANQIREFVPAYAQMVAPMNNILKGKSKRSTEKILWSEESTKAFDTCKNNIAKITQRMQPDLSLPFILTSDASNVAIGAILSQIKDGKRQMIAAFSKTLDNTQLNYSVTDKELLAAVKGIQYFKHYLLGKKFTLETDHQALKYLQQVSQPNSRLMRWSLFLQDYDFEVKYITGETNAADFFSRYVTSLQQIENQPSDSVKKKILQDIHIASGHGSANTMNFLIRLYVNWLNLAKDINDWITQCTVCAKSGNLQQNTRHNVIETTRPNEIWQIDLLGPLKQSERGNKYILVAIDHYTKWLETAAIPNKSAEVVIKQVKQLILEKHGIPVKILTDNGLEFQNALRKSLCTQNNVDWQFSSPDHHETVGAVERANQTLLNKIRKLSNFGGKDWESVLEAATHAVNISFNRSIQTSPYIFTKQMTPEFKKIKELGLKVKEIPFSESNHLRNTKRSAYEEKHIVKGQKSCKNDYQIGDSVLIFKQRMTKLEPNWHPNYTIHSKASEHAYWVENGAQRIRLNKQYIKPDQTKFQQGDVVGAK